MEYAAGELFERICNNGRFREDETSFFFQQLISGVSYCHLMQICHCHTDLKLENTLLDGSAAPRVKISDFGYTKDDTAALNEFFGKQQNKKVMFQVGPTIALNTRNSLDWVVRDIKLLEDIKCCAYFAVHITPMLRINLAYLQLTTKYIL